MSRARRAGDLRIAEMVAMARARFARVTARKARYVADLIRGLTVAEAKKQLDNVHRPSAVPVVKGVLESAVANAKDKEIEADPETLVIGEILVDGGPMLKRFQARAMGRGCRIRKRMSHVTIKLFTQA
jgi:large subunit ribosomal protein L22